MDAQTVDARITKSNSRILTEPSQIRDQAVLDLTLSLVINKENFGAVVVDEFRGELNGTKFNDNMQHLQLPNHILARVMFHKEPGTYSIHLLHDQDSPLKGHFTLAVNRSSAVSKVHTYSNVPINSEHDLQDFWPEGLNHLAATISAIECTLAANKVDRAKTLRLGQGIGIA